MLIFRLKKICSQQLRDFQQREGNRTRDNENPHGSLKKYKDAHGNYNGKHIDFWQKKETDYRPTRYSQFFTSVVEIFYKSEEVGDKPSSEDRVSSNVNQILKSIKQMCQDLYHNPQTSFKVTEGVRSPGISNFGHSHSKPPLSFSSTVANSDIANKWLLQSYRNPVLLNKESRMEFFR